MLPSFFDCGTIEFYKTKYSCICWKDETKNEIKQINIPNACPEFKQNSNNNDIPKTCNIVKIDIDKYVNFRENKQEETTQLKMKLMYFFWVNSRISKLVKSPKY